MRAFHLKEYLRHTNSRRFCPLVLFKGQILAYYNQYVRQSAYKIIKAPLQGVKGLTNQTTL